MKPKGPTPRHAQDPCLARDAELERWGPVSRCDVL